jgi:hypothetical protein
MKYHVIITGIDPEPERIYQSSGNYIEGCRIWAKSNLQAFSLEKRYANAEAIIYEVKEVEIERIKREGPVIELHDELAKIVEDIGITLTSEKGRDNQITLTEVAARIQLAMEKTSTGAGKK